jgi:hypothetical protein
MSPPPSFENVQYGFFPSDCSPQFQDGEPDGLKIAAPDKFHLVPGDRNAKLPFCVSLQAKSAFLQKFPQVFEALKVVVVDDDNGEVRSGNIWRDRQYIPSPRGNIPREELAGRIEWKYRTVDLLEFFPLPPRKASYHVYAMLEQYKSNVIAIQVEVD